jgi:hypothetical protein
LPTTTPKIDVVFLSKNISIINKPLTIERIFVGQGYKEGIELQGL